MNTEPNTSTSASASTEVISTFIYLTNLRGEPIGQYPLGQLAATQRTAECEFCPCVQPREVADWLETQLHGSQLLFWSRPSAEPFTRYICGSFGFGPLPGFFFVGPEGAPFRFKLSPHEATHLWAMLEHQGTRWNPEPIFTDGDPHHG